MKIALIGHGAMGRLIGTLAGNKGHEIPVVIDGSNAGMSASTLADELRGCDVAIDFSTAKAVRRNVEACMLANVALVEGTTGWEKHRDEVEKLVIESKGALVFGANFSIGVNLFYRVAEVASELFSKFPEYEVFVEEQHHSRKKDSPSGTALKLKEVISRHIDKEFGVSATRAGSIPGTHRAGFDGPSDQVLLEHTARSRDGFATGAIMAAEWIVGKKGFYEFTNAIDEMMKTNV